jgi:nitrogen fixation/metabolism regulation signal transduction histidine kinase
MEKLLSKLDPTKRVMYSLKFSAFIYSFIFIFYLLNTLIELPKIFSLIYFIAPIISIISGLTLIRYYYKLNFTWANYNKIGAVLSLFVSIIFSISLVVFLDVNKSNYTINDLIDKTGMVVFEILLFSFVAYMPFVLISIITGVFLEKSSYKIKLKRLLSIIFIVWALYKLFSSFNSEKKSYGIDTDGDGIKDAFDTNGDGLIDTIKFDSNGDGRIDTALSDLNGDGLIDTIASDTNGDGILDTFLSDSNGDGAVDTIASDMSGDGRIDTIIKDVNSDGVADVMIRGKNRNA